MTCVAGMQTTLVFFSALIFPSPTSISFYGPRSWRSLKCHVIQSLMPYKHPFFYYNRTIFCNYKPNCLIKRLDPVPWNIFFVWLNMIGCKYGKVKWHRFFSIVVKKIGHTKVRSRGMRWRIERGSKGDEERKTVKEQSSIKWPSSQ